jgi:hypothetical protein
VEKIKNDLLDRIVYLEENPTGDVMDDVSVAIKNARGDLLDQITLVEGGLNKRMDEQAEQHEKFDKTLQQANSTTKSLEEYVKRLETELVRLKFLR